MTGRRDIVDPRSDGPAVDLVNADAGNDIVLICEHASNRIPLSLKNLGLAGPALESHIAWDPGAAQVARFISRELDATLIPQRFSASFMTATARRRRWMPSSATATPGTCRGTKTCRKPGERQDFERFMCPSGIASFRP